MRRLERRLREGTGDFTLSHISKNCSPGSPTDRSAMKDEAYVRLLTDT